MPTLCTRAAAVVNQVKGEYKDTLKWKGQPISCTVEKHLWALLVQFDCGTFKIIMCNPERQVLNVITIRKKVAQLLQQRKESSFPEITVNEDNALQVVVETATGEETCLI